MRIAFLSYQAKKRKRLAFHEVENLLKIEELKSAYMLIEDREKERKRLAADLHENVGSLLSSLRMYADTFAEKEKSAEMKSMARKMGNIAEQATLETRRIYHNLDAGFFKWNGLQTAIGQLCEIIRVAANIQIHSVINVSHPISDELSFAVYQMVQDLCSQAIKQEKVSRTRLEITQIPDEYISIIFEMNGKGLGSRKDDKYALYASLQAKVFAHNGEINIDSGEHTGTTVIIEIPLHDGSKQN